MSKILFLSRVALLCNFCFLAAFLIQFIPVIRNSVITSTIIILGNVVAIVLNMLVNFLYLLLVFARRSITTTVPVWIVVINFLFFLIQVILLIK